MHSTPSVWLGLRMGPPVFHTHAPQPRKHPQTSLQPQGIKAAFKPQFILCPLLFALAFTISWSTLETALGKSLENDTWEPRGWKETILGALVRIRDYIRNGKHFKSRIKETWKLNGTRRWQSTPYPEQVRWESWTVAHIHSGLTLLLVNASASFFLPSYSVPKLFVLFLSLSFHFHFSFSIIECFCFLLFPSHPWFVLFLLPLERVENLLPFLQDYCLIAAEPSVPPAPFPWHHRKCLGKLRQKLPWEGVSASWDPMEW